MGKQWKQWETSFLGAPKSLQMVTATMKLKTLDLCKRSYDQLRHILKSRDITLPTKVGLVKATVFPVFVYVCEGWTIKKAECRKIDALNHGVGEDSWELLGLQGIQSVNPKGNQSWIFIGRADAEAETPILWPPEAKNWFTGKDPDAGQDWRQEKGTADNEMFGWHHLLDECESEQALGVGNGQGSLACWSPSLCHKKLDTAEQLNWTELIFASSGFESIQENMLDSKNVKSPCSMAVTSSKR